MSPSANISSNSTHRCDINVPDSVTLLRHTDRFKTVKTHPWNLSDEVKTTPMVTETGSRGQRKSEGQG